MEQETLAPLGAVVEQLLNHAQELKTRFEEGDNNWILSCAWVSKFADEVLKSLPERLANGTRANAHHPPTCREPSSCACCSFPDPAYRPPTAH